MTRDRNQDSSSAESVRERAEQMSQSFAKKPKLDGVELAWGLELFAEEQGFITPPAYYIRGEFNLTDNDGPVYSDEGHLWCRECANKLIARALAILPADKHEDHLVCYTDAYGEDTCPHCMACGETLDGTVSSYAVEEELSHYADHPIAAPINPRQAIELAQILRAAPDEPEVLKLGIAALALARGESPK